MYDFGLLLKQLRLQKGYSQVQVAKKLNKSKAVISRYESNQQMPPLETLINIANLYNVSLDYLAGLDTRSLVINDLTITQLNILESMIQEFSTNRPSGIESLSPQQLQILNLIIMEFFKH